MKIYVVRYCEPCEGCSDFYFSLDKDKAQAFKGSKSDKENLDLEEFELEKSYHWED